MQLILASQSKYRQSLLSEAGFIFQALPPQVNEDSFKQQIDDPVQLTRKLAYEKAKSLNLHRQPNVVVVGSDQVGFIDGKRIDKPGDRKQNIQQLMSMAGKTHQLITSLCVLSEVGECYYTDITHMTMRALSEEQISEYVSMDNPMDCAGGYKLEKAGICLFESIKTEDHTAIIGLPMLGLTNILIKLGYKFSFY